MAEEQETISISYPRTGKKDLPVGINTIDLLTGIVLFADGSTPDRLPHQITEETPCRALLIYTDAEIEVGTYIHKSEPVTYSSVFPWLHTVKKHPAFDTVQIKTTKLTQIFIAAATTAWGIPELDIADFYSGNPYVTRGTLAEDAEVEIDIRTNLGRYGHVGFIANVGPGVGELQVYEYDGISWTTEYYSIVKDGVENLAKSDIGQLKLVAANAGASYEVNMR